MNSQIYALYKLWYDKILTFCFIILKFNLMWSDGSEIQNLGNSDKLKQKIRIVIKNDTVFCR